MAATCTVTCTGYVDAAELSNVDLVALSSGILAGTVARPEVLIEIHDVSMESLVGSILFGPLYRLGDQSRPNRWCLTYADRDPGERWCLSVPGLTDGCSWYVLFGGETEVRESCALDLRAVLNAVHTCCAVGGRAPSLFWIPIERAFNLE